MMGQRTADTKGVGGGGQGGNDILQTTNLKQQILWLVEVSHMYGTLTKNKQYLFLMPFPPRFFFLVLVVVEGEWVGCVGDGVKAGGHSQTKGDTSAA